MSILYAKAGETEGYRWLHVIDLKTGCEVPHVHWCDVIKGEAMILDTNGEYIRKGRYKIYDERH